VVVNEAMASGLALITSDRVGAAADLLLQGRNGTAFPAGDADALADALVALYADAETCRRFGAASREIIASWDHEQSVEGFAAAVAKAAGDRS
jgi:glycosyltransferase involved in cell wall biosynthesis